MNILVTGSSGHLGEALVRTLKGLGHQVTGLDVKPSPYTDIVGDIAIKYDVEKAALGTEAIIHAATLHKPHVATHSKQDFIDTNITGTLNLLEVASMIKTRAFIMTSTTSTFGDALTKNPGEPAVWIDEEVVPKPKNIYGVTKLAAENLCELYYRNAKLNCIILRTSRFFPEEDDKKERRAAFSADNLKVNETLYRRADIADMVSAHLCALDRAVDIGFGKYIISGDTPFQKSDLIQLGTDAKIVLAKYFPDYPEIYARLNWQMFSSIDRVYCNQKAKRELLWSPKYTFDYILSHLKQGLPYQSELALEVGSKGYHDRAFSHGPYPVDE